MALVGLMASHPLDDGVFVDYICTDKSYRRLGIAKTLMCSLRASRVLLITSSFSRQHAFYTHIGFQPTLESPYEAGVGEVCLHAKLHEIDISVEPRSFADLPQGEVRRLLMSVGLRSGGMQRFLRPDDTSVEYRLIFDDHCLIRKSPKRRKC